MPPLARALAKGLLAVIAMAAVIAPGHAGPGHDHGAHQPDVRTPARPRLTAQSELYELVGILDDGKLTIYLDRMADTSPVTEARIELTVDGETGHAAPNPDGTYSYASKALQREGEHEVIAVISEGSENDLLVGRVADPHHHNAHAHDAGHDHAHGQGHEHGAKSPTEAPNRSSGLKTTLAHLFVKLGLPADATTEKLENAPVLAGLGVAFGLMLGALVRRRNGLIVGLIALVAVLGAGAAWAGPGHDHGEGGTSMAAADAPRRLPDGEIFLPKPTQRLLQIRTRVIQPDTARSTTQLIGRVIADPNRSGLVQSTIGGRIKPGEAGLPVLGQQVKTGQVLAYVEPAFAPIDASDVKQTAGDLAQRIAVLDARIARQKQLVERAVVSRASLEDLQIERAGLEARQKQLLKSRNEPEALLAPVSGVIANVHVAAGQVISPSDTLFNIVDPASLWVEAVTFDPRLEVTPAQSALAQTAEADRYKLTFVGRSRALQQQAGILHFRLAEPANALHIGTPVKVLIETGTPVTGLIVPRRAIAQAPNGQMVAFKRLEPERYLPLPVRYDGLDTENVVVTRGLKAGDQIIVEGAPLVNQIR